VCRREMGDTAGGCRLVEVVVTTSGMTPRPRRWADRRIGEGRRACRRSVMALQVDAVVSPSAAAQASATIII
jgi:hypothetical protein